MATAHAGGLHATVGGQVGRAERQALHAGRRRADLLHVGHAAGGLQDGVHEDRALEAGLGLELREQPVDVVDVLRSLHLRDHDHVELVADLGDRGGEVVEAPWRVERVHAGPQLRLADLPGLAHLDEAGAGRLLVGGGHSVLEVGEQHVDGRCDVGHLGDHLGVGRGEEVDDARRPRRDLAQRIGRADRERTEEVLGRAHHLVPSTSLRAMTLRQRISSAPSKIESTRAST